MGSIRDKHEKNKRKERDDDPLSGGLGDRKQNTNDFDTDEDTIKDQKNKK